MNKSYIFPVFILACLGLSLQKSSLLDSGWFHASAVKNGGGSSPGFTGAPGEESCTACHSGSVLDGANENVLIVTDGVLPVSQYVPGASYTVSLAMSSNPAKKGFQATALDVSGQMAGTFTAGVTTSINGSVMNYANHKSLSNTAITPAWTWNWKAPSTNVGKVTFYVASNVANNNGGSNGDKIYLSQHILTAQAGAGVEESLYPVSKMNVAYDSQNGGMILTFSSLNTGEMTVNFIDMNGRSVFKSEIGTALIGENTHKISLPSDLRSGLYVVHLLVNNNTASAKLKITN
jgi:hypothetical protein